MPKKSWFEAKQRGQGGAREIAIFSDIGGFGVTAQDFYNALGSFGKSDDLLIRISSDGGDVFVGFAIYNMLRRHAGNKVVQIEGLAASMASVIAMSGDEIEMPSNAMLMIHNPWGGVVGESDQIVSFGEALQKMRNGIVKAYQDRTGIKRGELLAMMDRETWLDAKESVAKGFADRVEKPMQMAARATFNIGKFVHVPESFGRIIKEKTMAKKPKSADEEESEDVGEKSPADIRKEILATQKEIRSLCNLAGKPDAAQAYIDDDKTVAEVLKDLDAKREAAAKAKPGSGTGGKAKADTEVSAHHNTQGGEGPSLNPSDIYARWNKPGSKRAA